MTRAELAGIERVDDLDVSWHRRRALYVERLGSGSGFLVLALQGD
ncbi:MAG TPA: hypothetical protein VMJ65_13235 [Solirubrobacteraceae bacterium]|nr:hypothetical protein [Solirubrobacteraceae bacterium]